MNKTTQQAQGKLYGIGTGPGDPDLLTVKAVKALKSADVIYVPKSKDQASTVLHIVGQYLPEGVQIDSLEFSMSRDKQERIKARMENAGVISQQLQAGKTIAFLTLGDPMLYSTYSYILEYLKADCEVETIPGIYSFAAISSLLSIPLVSGNERLAVVTTFDDQTEQIMATMDTVVCMKVSAYYDKLYAYLSKAENYRFVMITDAGKAGQKVYESVDILKNKVPYFSTVIFQREKVSAKSKGACIA